MAEKQEVNSNGNKALTRWGLVAAIAIPVLGAFVTVLFWLFQANANATQALSLAQEAKAIAQAKADADDVKRLDDDIRELRKSLEDAELIERRKR